MESVNFDRAAGFYDATRALPAESRDELTALLAAELAGRQPCLEIGVGTGRIALPLHSRGITLAGEDISAGMLGRLVANAGGAPPFPLLRADATRLPFAAATFGAVLAVHVLHLIPDWRVAVDEALRVLRPGGALVAGLQGQTRAQWSGVAPGGTAPWAGALRQSLRRRGIVRVPVGTRDPDLVASYLAGRATARRLDPVPVRRTRTLADAIERIERQVFSWTWDHPAEQMRAVAGDIRDWAARENVPLDTEHAVDSAIRWWAFELPG
jgi:ubiquinone/menaquinone biosynthesis C-methylase UbiE